MKKNIWLEKTLVIIGLVIGLSTSAFAGGKKPSQERINDYLSVNYSIWEQEKNEEATKKKIALARAQHTIAANARELMSPERPMSDTYRKKVFSQLADGNMKAFTHFFTQALVKTAGDSGKAPIVCAEIYAKAADRTPISGYKASPFLEENMAWEQEKRNYEWDFPLDNY